MFKDSLITVVQAGYVFMSIPIKFGDMTITFLELSLGLAALSMVTWWLFRMFEGRG